MKYSILNGGFRITDTVNIRGANKLLFALSSDYKESMILFLYLFDLFECSLIIPISCDSFQHIGDTSPAETKVMINSESMRIAVAHYHFPGRAVKFIKMSHLEFFKIDLDACPEIKVIIVCGFI